MSKNIVSSSNYCSNSSFLHEDATKIRIQALVISGIGNANSLLTVINKSYINRLQSIQNSTARLSTRSSIRDHITPFLYQLHWLPVEYHVRFKVLLLCFNCLRGSAPKYLVELLNIREQNPLPSLKGICRPPNLN
ncbi:hypothetical protein HOLleu_27668 [Holothuria leucospilota]|uniref:Uncharacterized protein n=1 Tax=Holothuria leucospilota TaxID=206669 RepID=A0A9Q1H2X7_HOLLE|nr:hypothetical protein HOLleu_27668 [Holothuria leucospilota]